MDVKNMNPLVVVVLFMCTFGIFGLYWLFKTKCELNSKGAEVPTMWYFLAVIIPLVNVIVMLFWLHKFMEGFIKVAKVPNANPILYTIAWCVPLVNLYMIYTVQTAMNKL